MLFDLDPEQLTVTALRGLYREENYLYYKQHNERNGIKEEKSEDFNSIFEDIKRKSRAVFVSPKSLPIMLDNRRRENNMGEEKVVLSISCDKEILTNFKRKARDFKTHPQDLIRGFMISFLENYK